MTDCNALGMGPVALEVAERVYRAHTEMSRLGPVRQERWTVIVDSLTWRELMQEIGWRPDVTCFGMQVRPSGSAGRRASGPRIVRLRAEIEA